MASHAPPPRKPLGGFARFALPKGKGPTAPNAQSKGATKEVTMVADANQLDWAKINLQDANALAKIMTRDTPWRGIESVPRDVARSVMDKLQSEVDKIPPEKFEVRKKHVKCLVRLGEKYDFFPSQFIIHKDALKNKPEPTSLGGPFSDIFCGEVRGHPGRVCLKLLRIHTIGRGKTGEKAKKMLCREALSWRQVSHPNILPFYGVSNEMLGQGRLCFISPWMEKGNVLDYLDRHPDHDRRGWVWDVSAGLSYLHQLDPCIVHKDIRCANLLVGEDLRCYLVDFGIGIVSETLTPGTGATRWLPPEVFNDSFRPDDDSLRKVDIYSFGRTIVEMYTRRPPFENVLKDAVVVIEIQKKKLPSQPPSKDMPTTLWNTVVAKALSRNPANRPSAADIKTALEIQYKTYLDQYEKESRTKSLTGVLQWRT